MRLSECKKLFEAIQPLFSEKSTDRVTAHTTSVVGRNGLAREMGR